MDVPWRIGAEIELIAPAGASRRDYADRLAARIGGTVEPFLFPQSEPRSDPRASAFRTLTVGLGIFDPEGVFYAQVVDDLTLQADLELEADPKPGWFRILSDDERLLRLIQRHVHPTAAIEEILAPIAAMFGTEVETGGPRGMCRVRDAGGNTIAVVAHQPGERERGAEIVSRPIARNHHEELDELLVPATELGFLVPEEGATHLHFDATRLRSAGAFRRVVLEWPEVAGRLQDRFPRNPRCTRLGPLSEELSAAVREPGFEALAWDAVVEGLSELELSKYRDLNVVNLLRGHPGKLTLEVRTLPVLTEAQAIVEAARVVAGWLEDVASGA